RYYMRSIDFGESGIDPSPVLTKVSGNERGLQNGGRAMDLPTGLKDKKMAHSTQRPGGGKPRQPAENERVVLSVRVTPQLKARIDQAALKSGRSQSQQVEHALARDAEREDLLVDALRLSTGLQQAGLLVAIVEAFRCVGQVGAHISR